MIRKQLGQTQTAAATPTSIYQPAVGVEASNLTLTCVNTTASEDTIRIYQDNDGSIKTTATALYYDFSIAAKTTVVIAVGPMNNSAGNLFVESATLNAVTFTLHGWERHVA